MQKFFDIIIDFNIRYKAARDIVAGIMRYAASNPKWILHMRGNHPANDRYHVDNHFEVDGVISGYDLSRHDEPGQDEIRRLFKKGTSLKAIAFVCAKKYAKATTPAIHIDLCHQTIAHAAYKTLASHGLKNFAYLGTSPHEECSRLRGQFFKKIVASHGGCYFEFKHSSSKHTIWANELADLKEWVLSLPKPSGVFAVFDQRAKHLIDVCRAIGVSVPKEIQVIGVDNEESLCELTTPSLSSIEPDFELAGYQAALELNKLLENPEYPSKSYLINKLSIIERLSTTDITRTGDRVNRAINFIRNHASEAISVHDVAKSVGGSIRLLEKDFQQIRKHSISAEIQNIRIELTATLLKTTSLPFASILKHSGYKNISHLMTLFKKKYNITMSQFREKHRTG